MVETQKVSILSLGLIRGLIAQILGTIAGMGLTMLIRVIVGLPAWKAEPVWVAGTFIGVIAFMIAIGAMNDWFKWAKGES
ncbi:MAG: hypothetical protein PVG32_17445, partial [Anaerolineales bacterium]